MIQETKQTSDTIKLPPPLAAAEKRQYYPATLQQEGVWYQSLLLENKAGWNSFHGWRCIGPFDRGAFERAVLAVAERHAALRTSFFMMGQQLYQRVHPSFSLEDYFRWHDLSHVAGAEAEAYRIGARDADRPFDLEAGPLTRFLLFRLAPEDHIVIINKHHIVFDVASRQVLWQDLTHLYRDFAAGRLPTLRPLKLQYCDFALWQRHILAPSRKYQEQKNEWLARLEPPLPVFSPLGVDVDRGQAPVTGTVIARLDRELVDRLRSMSLRQRISFAAVFLSAYTLLLHYYGGEREIMAGTVYRGRNADKIHLDRAIGLFVNRLALRLRAGAGEDTVAAFMQSVHRELAGAYKRQDVVFEDLLRNLQPSGDEDRHPVFQVTFNMLKVPNIIPTEGEPLTFRREWDNADRDTPVASRYPLSLYIRDDLEGVDALLLYSTKLLGDGAARRFLRYYEALLQTMSRAPASVLRDMALPDEREKREILEGFNNTKRDFNMPQTITALVEDIARRHPDRIALAFEDMLLTFKQLDLSAGRVAYMLAARALGAGQLIPLLSVRSLVMIIGMMGILKAGGAYVPLDPSAPPERLQGVLSDIDGPRPLTEAVVEDWVAGAVEGPLTPVSVTIEPESLAYVIFTSGSTGVPKGVGVEHAAIVNTLLWRKDYYDFGLDDRVLQIPNFTFDASVIDIFNPLIQGSCLFLAHDEQIKHFGRLVDMVEKYCVTHFLMVPNFYRAFLEELDRPLPAVRVVTLGGESVSPELLALHGAKLMDAKLVNEYGPTENSVCSTAIILDSVDGIITVGTPIANCLCLILDHNDRLCPVGIPGHLHLGGRGLARGYINNPHMTAERFISSPFNDGERIYRSGDLARWLPDGSIDFLGRIDNQVKIRGFRIELGEIESQLSRLPGVEEAAVRVENDRQGHPFIVAYITGSGAGLRDRLTDRLPTYMIPAQIMELAHMPRTASGKIDRNKLPPLESVYEEEEFEAPAGAIQSALADAWQSVLGRSPIGIRQNFFALGGDSIKAMQVVARLQAGGLQLELAHLFSHPTIQRLSPFVTSGVRAICQHEISGPVPFIPIQHWFMRKNLAHPHHFNMARLFTCAPGIPADHFRRAADELTRGHDMLRAVLSRDNLSLDIRPVSETPSLLRIFDLDPADGDNIEGAIKQKGQELHQSFDLYSGPLVIFALLRTERQDFFLIIAHHLVMDGVSLRILEEDLESALAQLHTGGQLHLPPKSHSFPHWSLALSAAAQSRRLQEQSEYWRGVCRAISDCRFPAANPPDLAEGTQEDYLVAEAALDEGYTVRLLKDVHRVYNTTIDDILLCGLATALHETFGCGRAAVNLESHGRHPFDGETDITRTVGWFTCQYPVVLETHAGEHGLHICRVKEMLRRVPDHGIGYGILRYREGEAEDSPLHTEPQISFNYMGQLDQTGERDLLGTCRLDTGRTRSPRSRQLFPLTFNGRLAEGRLRFTIKGDSRRFGREAVERLSRCFSQSLEELIDHCREQTHPIATPSDFSAASLTENELAAILAIHPEKTIEEIFDLSPMQEGMLFHHEMEPGSLAYAVQTVYRLEGDVDVCLFEESLNRLSRRHEVFRLGFVFRRGSRPRQVVFASREPEFEFMDLTLASGPAEELENVKMRELQRRFDLETDPAVRFFLVKTCSHEFYWIVTNHHILMDGWSNPVWLDDFLAIYRHLKQKQEPKLHEPVPFSNYLRWLARQDREAASRFWGEYLTGLESPTRLEFHNRRAGAAGFERDRHTIELPVPLSSALTRAANDMEVTLSNLMQAAWTILLHRYSGSFDVVFGTVISGRHVPIEGVERTVGLFINTAPLRVKMAETDTVASLASDIRDTMVQCQRYSYLPLSEAAQAAGIGGSIFEHLFVYENYPVQPQEAGDEFSSQAGFKITDRSASEQTNYNLNLLAIPRERLVIRFQYNGLVYSRDFVEGLGQHLLTLLEGVAADPRISLANMEIVPPEEKQLIMHAFNATNREFPSQTTIHEWFLRQAHTTPAAAAIRASSRRKAQAPVYDVMLTYDQLLRSAAAVAACLVERGVESGSLVAVMGERSCEVMIAIFAALLAGCAYMPIDPDYPLDRILYMLNDSNVGFMLCHGQGAAVAALAGRWRGSATAIDCFCRPKDEELPLPAVQTDSLSPAYLIYTSGSTGRPKGVLLEHRPLCNRLHWMQGQYPVGPGDTLLHKTPFTFDVSVWEIFWWSITGAAVTLLTSGGEKEPGLIAEALVLNRISVIHFVPSMMKAFLDFMQNRETAFRHLRWLIASGETLTAALQCRFRRLFANSGTRLANLYGPTEACIDVTFCICPDDRDLEHVPIGSPIDNTVMMVLGPEGGLQPIGVAGELCIAGAGLARGYLNRPELTHDAFIEEGFARIPRFYKSGDLACWLPDGCLLYLGRLDRQVKIRGFRIELGEIESALLECQGVKDAAAEVWGTDDDCVLAGYIVPANGGGGRDELDIESIRSRLALRLPDYMAPSFFYVLAELPLNANGKLERSALPKPGAATSKRPPLRLPRDEVEQELADLWCLALKLPEVGLDDHFFALGGHSLRAMNLAGGIRKRFEVDVAVRAIFDYPVLSSLSLLVKGKLAQKEELLRLLSEVEAIDGS